MIGFRKCQQNEAAYPAFQLGNSMKLEQLTAHWTWTGLSTSLAKLKVDLKGLRILTPSLQEKLQTLLYACGPNLTEHKSTVGDPETVETEDTMIRLTISLKTTSIRQLLIIFIIDYVTDSWTNSKQGSQCTV